LSITNLIPLAGDGKRFKDDGYLIPKPLIKVSNLPMIVQAAYALPKSDNFVFLCRQEHLMEFPLEAVLKSYFKNATIITVDHLTEGQASTCLLAESKVDMEAPLNIGACDNSMIYDENVYTKMMSDPETDALIWTFRNNSTVKHNPQMYGWVRTGDNNVAQKVSVKIPLSDNPVKDHAVVGAFSFKKAKYFFKNTHQMIEKNRRINNEFYVDECMNLLIENGLNVKILEVNNYICWGTPNDLKTFEYWQNFFNLTPHHPYSIDKDPNYGRN